MANSRTGLVIRPITNMLTGIRSLYQRPPNTIRDIDLDAWMSPGQPVQPFGPPGTEPRAFQTWTGQNQIFTPRSDAEYSAQDLKAMATYPLARICIENVKDTVTRAPWEIQLKPHVGETRKDVLSRAKGDANLSKLNNFFQYPDREHNWQEWLRPLLDDLLVIDAASILLNYTRKGELVEMPTIHGEMICRLIDQNGFTPLPPSPAYSQNWWGLPLLQLTTDQLVYKPRNIVGRGTLSSQLYGMCYRDGTEVLTESGWKLFEDVDIQNDRIATRNLQTKAFEWQLATAKQCYDYTGDLIRFHSNVLDLEVTPLHRMIIDRFSLGGGARRAKAEAIVTAEELEKHGTSATGIPVTSLWQGVEIPNKRFPNIAEDQHPVRLALDTQCRELRSTGASYSQIAAKTGVAPMTAYRAVTRNRKRDANDGRVLEMTGDDYCALLGLYLSEGSCCGTCVYIAQSETNPRIAEMRATLERINGGPVLYSNEAFIIGSKFLVRHLRPLGHATDKYIPQEIMEATPRQLKIFWHHFWLGDGDKARSRAFTSSKRMADQLQELAQKMGTFAAIKKTQRGDRIIQGRKGPRVILAANTKPNYTVTVFKRAKLGYSYGYDVDRHAYSGKVHCLTVPNGVMYVRRNGKAAFSGNSPTEQLAPEIEIGIQRMKFVLAYYSEGSVPGVVQIVPRGTSIDRIEEAMDWQNSQMAGNLAKRTQWRLIQGFQDPGKVDQILFPKEPLLAGLYDEKHIREVAFGYGTSPQRLMKMIRTEGKASSDSAEVEGTLPWVLWVKGVVDYIIQRKMGFTDYEIAIDPYAEPDPLKNAAALQMLVANAILTPNEARKRVGEELRPEPEADRLGVISGTGFTPIGIPSVTAGVMVGDDGKVKPHPVTPTPPPPNPAPAGPGAHNATRSKTPASQAAGSGRSTGRNTGASNGKESLDGKKKLLKRHESRIEPGVLTPTSQQSVHVIQHAVHKVFRSQAKLASIVVSRFHKTLGTILTKREFGNVQFNLSPDDAAKVLEISVDSTDLAEKGRDLHPHVTVLWGFHQSVTTEQLDLITKGIGDVDITLGPFEAFPEGPDGVPLVIRVESEKLRKLRENLKILPHTSTWPDYKPHICIAYLKPDADAQQCVNAGNPLEGETFTLSELIYSAIDYSVTELAKLMLPSERIRRLEKTHAL